MPPKDLAENEITYCAVNDDGEYKELGRLGYLFEADIESETENDAITTPMFSGDSFTATVSIDWDLLRWLLKGKNNWRKYHGLPMLRRHRKSVI